VTKDRVRGYPNEPVTTAIRPSTHRSAFSAAFFSFLFPGLGQAYVGAYVRAIALAVPPLLAIVIAIGLFLGNGVVDFGLWVGQTSVLGPLAIVNVVLLAYRALASLDAYRLAVEPARPSTAGIRHLGRRPGQIDPLSIAGLAMILVVLVAGHVIVGYWDLKLYNLAKDVHTPFVFDTSSPEVSASPEPTVTFPPQETLAPAPTVMPWNKTERLNVLLIGADAAAGLTDTMMVASLDPVTHQVAMFSIPRDTVGLQMPPKSRLSQYWGSNFNYKLNELYKDSDRVKYPGGGPAALKQALGYTFFGNQSAIQYYALVNFEGFQAVVDTLGGVTINVPAPLKDDGFPGNHRNGMHLRIYVPAGIQHMNGDQALAYARARHPQKLGGGASSLFNDYNRSARQQQILVALEQQANFTEISSHLGDLLDALGQTIHTDVPEGSDVLGPLIQLAKSIKPDDIKTYVFTGPSPNLPAIRAAVKAALAPGSKSPDQLQAAIDENAPISVENGTGISGQDTTLATYLQGLGLNAQASTGQPTQLGGTTKLICINGANTQYAATTAQLEQMLGLSGDPSTNPGATIQLVIEPDETTQFVIVTGTNTPALKP
jgi:LCP family protein required for cell wall assembly